MVETVMERLESACVGSMPSRVNPSLRHTPVYWWNETIAAARRVCNHARRRYQRARGRPSFLYWQTLFRESRKTLKNAIKESIKRCFLALCDTLDDDPWGKAYQIVIKRIGARRSPPPPDDLLRGIVMDLFPSVEEDNAWLPDTASNDGLPLKLVTSEEVLKCVRSMKQTGAPGPDGIPARALMLACSLHPEAFSAMLNKCLEEAVVPDRWKTQKLVL
ncbi:hypothetical protein KR215_000932, partial [Drosophila sulfurigaster]